MEVKVQQKKTVPIKSKRILVYSFSFVLDGNAVYTTMVIVSEKWWRDSEYNSLAPSPWSGATTTCWLCKSGHR